MRRIAAISLLAFVALVGTATAFAFVRNALIARRFAKVQVGTSEGNVRRALGRPSWVEPCGKSFGTPKPHCTEYIYRNSFAPLIPEYYSVSLDDTGHVLSTYVYESP
jgi:hypothetical protein